MTLLAAWLDIVQDWYPPVRAKAFWGARHSAGPGLVGLPGPSHLVTDYLD